MYSEYSDKDLVDLAELRRLVSSGEVKVCSPFEGMDKPWTEEAKNNLTTALAGIFNWNEKPNKTT